MSRRGLVLEGYQAPESSRQTDPMDAQRLVAQERMHNKSLAQKQNPDNSDALLKYADDHYKTDKTPSNSNVLQKKGDEEMAKLYQDSLNFIKLNPTAREFDLAHTFSDRASRVNQLYTTGKIFRENVDNATKELEKKDAGYNANQLSISAQEHAFLNPDGTVKDDLSGIDANNYQQYIDAAINSKPTQATSMKGLENHIYNKDAIKTDELATAYQDKHRGLVKERVSISIPQDYELKKNAKGFNVVGDDGNYVVVPKNETLPDGTQVVDKGVFDRLPKSYQDRANGEARTAIETFNKMTGSNIHTRSVEADTIARKFAFEDMSKLWNNGGVKRLVEKREPPAPRITINNNSGKGSDATPIDIYTPTFPIVKEHMDNVDNYKPIITDDGTKIYGAVPVNSLPDETSKAFFEIAKGKDSELKSIGEIFLKMTDKDGIGIIRKSDNTLLTTITERGANTVANKPYGTKTVNAAKNQSGGKEEAPKGKTYNLNGKTITEQKLIEGAARYKMSVADYKKSIGL